MQDPSLSIEEKIQRLSEKQSTKQYNYAIKLSKKPVIFIFLLLLLLTTTALVFFLLPEKKPTSHQKMQPTSETAGENLSSSYSGSSTINLESIPNPELRWFSSGYANRNITNYNIAYTIVASLPNPDENYRYKAWLVKIDSPEDYILLNFLEKNSQGLYELVQNKIYYPEQTPSHSYEELYNTIVISLENDEEPNLTNKVLEGTFTK